MQHLKEFLLFLKNYFGSRALIFGRKFEKTKDLIVAILIVKRGKYSSSFLNTSFFLLVFTTIVGGPIIAENNPFGLRQDDSRFQSAIVTYNPYESALGTVISAKPRDKVVEYNVLGGDTLESIAKKFNISVDTIKWENDLTTNTIRPNETLRIPPVSGIVHNVKSGENIYSIADRYNSSPQKIINFPFNDFADLDTFALIPGQSLIIPDGVPPVEQPKYIAQQQVTEIQAGVQGTSNFIWPTTGSISQNPVWYHMAVDIQNPAAPAVIASDTGTVTFAGCLGYGYGCHVVVNHANGFETLYGHLSSIGVTIGEAVTQGQSVGVMGCTGLCSGTHLHFEIRANGALQNPLSYLQ
ncbi:peptidoglycan DD-metalloendopeptidase family protein [Candidatus Roizmanbacteria bacterium]|nr:peptidoglycan DD-metalloendopeptidase family protein [Candidatus Roizmanbacteria bacterium]